MRFLRGVCVHTEVGREREGEEGKSGKCTSRSASRPVGMGLQATITNTSSAGDKVRSGAGREIALSFRSLRQASQSPHTPFHSDHKTATAMDFSQFNDAERNHLQRVMEQKQVLLTTIPIPIPTPTPTPTPIRPLSSSTFCSS